jgi:predicted dithiol-disulfide oxidoreductase (DUF899 family)
MLAVVDNYDATRRMTMEKPKIVTAEEWQQARDELLVAEKEATRAIDSLAARRRRLPMVKFDTGYAFDTPGGTKSLLGLFEGRGQLVVYQFMDNGPDHYCPGCTWYSNNIPGVVGVHHGQLTHGNIIATADGQAGRASVPPARPGGYQREAALLPTMSR